MEALLQRGTSADLKEAQAAIDRLAAEPTDPGFVLFEVPLLRLRALLARAHGDAATYAQFRDRYRAMAKTRWLRSAYRLGRGDAVTAAVHRASAART